MIEQTRRKAMRNTIINLVLFKVGWVACILFAAMGKPLFATAAVAITVAIHLYRVPVPAKEALWLACAGLTGLVWESVVVWSGLIEYPAGIQAGLLAPYWIVSMWVLFATTINFGFKWIKRHWLLGATFGLVGGPLAFLAGTAAGAAQFSNTTQALLLLGVGWAVLLPFLAILADTIIDSTLFEPKTKQRMDEHHGIGLKVNWKRG